jgi:hypothetical protein
VAGETVERGSGELMAPGTKLTGRIDRNVTPLRVFADMAIDTPGQAVIRLADTLVHGDVTLMLYKLEVITAHEGGRRHAGIEFVRLCRTLYPFACMHHTQASKEAEAQYQQQT